MKLKRWVFMAWKFRQSDMNLHDPFDFWFLPGKKKNVSICRHLQLFSDLWVLRQWNHWNQIMEACSTLPASSQTQGTHLQLLKEQGKNGSTVEWQGLKFVQPNKQNHSELKVIDSCLIVWRRVEVLIGWVFYSARGFLVRLFIACLCYVIIVARTSIVLTQMRKHKKTLPKSLQQQNLSKKNCTSEHFEFGSIIFNHNIYIYIYCIFFSCPSHVATPRVFPTPQKTPAVHLGPLGAPLRSKIPDPEPLQSWTVARYQGPAVQLEAAWWTPGLVVSG